MTTEGTQPSREQLEAAIAAQERLRSTLGDVIVDATIAALRTQLAQLTEVAQQRKLATVLFMDVVGSTKLIQGRDPEEAMAIMDSTLTRLGEAVRDHAGRVLKYTGDGFMAVFGLPKAQENDPEMALRSALAIVEVAGEVASDLEAEHGISGFAVRVGVNTGLVATGGVTEAEATIIGDAVNLASRLESAAPAGGVLISRDTLQHVRGLFEIEDSGTVEAKGFADPVAVYQVVRRAPGDAGRTVRGVEGVDIPMVGRQHELAQLLEAFESASARGEACSVTVLGEAGLGKSRLLLEFRSRVSSPEHLLWETRATLETRDLPYASIRTLLEQRYAIRSDDNAETVRRKLVAGVANDLDDDPDAEQKAHFVGQLVGYDFSDSRYVHTSLENPQQIRSRAVMYLAELIASLSSRHTVALLVEDVHWADAGSLDVLDELLAALAGSRVLVVATARPSLRDQRPTWGTASHHQWIRLSPLSDAHSEELVTAALRKVVDCPDDLRRRLVEQAGGNPYYLEEIIRMLIDDGVIVPGDEVWTVGRHRLPDMRIPPTLTGVIQARLDGLPPSQRSALQQASVIGRVFWDAIVEQLAASDAAGADVASTLDALGRREMVHELATSTFSSAAEYTFHHEILRSVAYEGVLLRVRLAYHALVADWLIDHRGDRGVELAGLIAGHLERAGRDGEALDYFTEAAEAALAAYAVEAADEFYDRALHLTPAEDTDRRYTLLLGREKMTGMRGQRDEQRSALDELAILAGDDPHATATVAVRRALFHYFMAESSKSADAAGAAVEAAAHADDRALEAQARYALAWALVSTADLEAAQLEATRALSCAQEAHDERAEMNATNILGMIALARSDYSLARRHLTTFLQAARRMENLERESTALNNLGVVETRLGDYPAAQSRYERAHQIAAEVGDRSFTSTALVNLAWVTASQGNWPAARELAERGVAGKREVGQTEAVAEGLMWLGHAELGLDHPGRAREAYSEALQIRGELGQTALAMGAHAGLGRTALAAEDLDAAVSHANVVTRHLDEGGTLAGTWEPLRIHLTCVEILRAAGDPDAERLLERACNILIAESERITDDRDRRTFLERVPWHRRILELSSQDRSA